MMFASPSVTKKGDLLKNRNPAKLLDGSDVGSENGFLSWWGMACLSTWWVARSWWWWSTSLQKMERCAIWRGWVLFGCLHPLNDDDDLIVIRWWRLAKMERCTIAPPLWPSPFSNGDCPSSRWRWQRWCSSKLQRQSGPQSLLFPPLPFSTLAPVNPLHYLHCNRRWESGSSGQLFIYFDSMGFSHEEWRCSQIPQPACFWNSSPMKIWESRFSSPMKMGNFWSWTLLHQFVDLIMMVPCDRGYLFILICVDLFLFYFYGDVLSDRGYFGKTERCGKP